MPGVGVSLGGIVLIVAGLLLVTFTDSAVGAWLAIVEVVACMSPSLVTHRWVDRHKDDVR